MFDHYSQLADLDPIVDDFDIKRDNWIYDLLDELLDRVFLYDSLIEYSHALSDDLFDAIPWSV